MRLSVKKLCTFERRSTLRVKIIHCKKNVSVKRLHLSILVNPFKAIMLEHIVAKIDIQIIKLRHFGTMFVLLVNFFELNMKNTYIMLAI